MDQMTLNDIFPDIVDPPKVWECMKTCANFKVYEPDEFPMGGERCTYGLHKDGCTGKDWYQKVVNNEVSFYCRYYKKG